MRRIHDFYRHPPRVGQTIVLLPVYDRGDEEEDWAWFALEQTDPIPDSADQICVYGAITPQGDETMMQRDVGDGRPRYPEAECKAKARPGACRDCGQDKPLNPYSRQCQECEDKAFQAKADAE